MEQLNINDMLKRFISGDIDVDSFSEVIDQRLFELRQKPGLTPEQERLSNFELLIHEIKEGYRNLDELYECIFSELENNISEHLVTTITLNSSDASESQIITRANPVKDLHLKFSLV